MDYFNEGIRNNAFVLINESLGSFDEQIAIAEEIGKTCYEMLLNKVNRNVFEVNSNAVKQVDLTINRDTPNYEITANINKLDSDGTINIELSIPLRYRFIGDKDIMVNKISNILSHELMYGNIFLKRFENDVEINDAPEYYPNLLAIIENEDQTSDIYQIAFALYSTYYHEVQSFISQTAKSIKDMYGGKLTYTNDEIVSGIMKSESYIIYSNIAHGRIQEILGYDDTIYKEVVLPSLKEYDINLTTIELKKLLRRAILVSRKALRKIFKNAMLLKIKPRIRF